MGGSHICAAQYLATENERVEGETMLVFALVLVVGLIMADVTDLMKIRPRRVLP